VSDAHDDYVAGDINTIDDEVNEDYANEGLESDQAERAAAATAALLRRAVPEARVWIAGEAEHEAAVRAAIEGRTPPATAVA